MAETFSTLLITGDLHPNTCGFVTTDNVLMIFITCLRSVEGIIIQPCSKTFHFRVLQEVVVTILSA